MTNTPSREWGRARTRRCVPLGCHTVSKAASEHFHYLCGGFAIVQHDGAVHGPGHVSPAANQAGFPARRDATFALDKC